MTAAAPAIPRWLVWLVARVRRGRRRDHRPTIGLHLHDVPEMSVRLETDEVREAVLLGACMQEGAIICHFAIRADAPMAVVAVRQAFGEQSYWIDAPEPMRLEKGAVLPLEWPMIWGVMAGRTIAAVIDGEVKQGEWHGTPPGAAS